MTPFAEPATILTPTSSGNDGLGNPTPGAPTQTPTSGAFAPAGSSVLIQGQLTVLDHDTFYVDDGQPAPGVTDHLQVRGVTYQVDGEPATYRNPYTGDEPGPVVRLLRVTG